MFNNSIIKKILLLIIVCFLFLAPESLFLSKAYSRTNIIFILADDLGYMDVGGYAKRTLGVPVDQQYYETPHIDRLMEEGLSFSRAYATQLCSPTRASLLTGIYAMKLGFTTASWHGRPTYYMEGKNPPEGWHPQDIIHHYDAIDEPQAWLNGSSIAALYAGQSEDRGFDAITIAEQLRDYHSAFIGKWHLGGHGAEGYQPADQGFEPLAWYDAGGSPYFGWHEKWDNKTLHLPTMNQDELMIGDSGNITGEEYLTDDLTAQALAYLDKRANKKDQPFFLYFNHFAVHGPWQSRADDKDYFETKLTRGWNSHRNAGYAAMLKSLDLSIGKIVQKLKETGLDKNTLLVFMSDNGGILEVRDQTITSNAPLKGGKAMLYEGGIRVPLIFWQPGHIPEGKWCDVAVHCTDLFPTLSEIADYKVHHEIDGESLVSLFKDTGNLGEAYRRNTFYWHYPFNVGLKDVDYGLPITPHSSIIQGDWKLIFDWHGKLRLYNLKEDISEKVDLSDVMPAKTKQLFHLLRDWLKENVRSHYFPSLNPAYDRSEDTRPYSFRDLWIQDG